ncbi:hypothetical protein CTI12_AA500710 [Artemisia annua]|uniref:Uncharacterized protein n=1 Tax=Artemisia annua TaxID=35608 RepID=A0A2U1LE73_ARTAN|nr:hypothetical protein CTI12_AA500710 [Artemisia annua]
MIAVPIVVKSAPEVRLGSSHEAQTVSLFSERGSGHSRGSPGSTPWLRGPCGLRIHGLNRHYYSVAINYRKNELEEKMLLNLHKKKFTDGLTLERFDTHSKTNDVTV